MMSDDVDTMDDTKNPEVTDDSCTVEFIEIVPLQRSSDDYHTSEFVCPIAVLSPEDIRELKQETADENGDGDSYYNVKKEPADEYDSEDPCFTLQVSSAYTM